MSRFRMIRRGLLSSAGSGSAVSYDTRFGTATDASGWFTFGLHSGNRRVWVNSSGGNDSNDGLSAATAKATFEAAFTVFASGFTAGDQVMIAGTGGRSYTNTSPSNNMVNKGGISATYPTAILSYDPADAANSAKYGKLVGADMPTVTLGIDATWTNSFSAAVKGTNTNYIAIQGIAFDGQGLSSNAIKYIQKHDGIVFQHCRFNDVQISIDNAADAAGYNSTGNISKCAFFGQWNSTSGNASGFFGAELDGFYFQDNVFIHCGWKLGASRIRNATTYPNTTQGNSDWAATGGPAVFGHGTYYSAYNINGRFDRIVYANNAADGFNIRGSAACTQIVSVREPIAMNMGGFSSSSSEAPSGVLITVDDYVVMGGADMDSSINPRGYGVTSTNTNSGSYIRNAAFFDNPISGGVNNRYFDSYRSSNVIPTQTYLLDQISGYNYSPTLAAVPDPATSSIVITNSSLEVAVSGSGVSGSNNTVSTGATYPNKKTMAQVITAMGFASENAMYDAMVEYPHLPWAQAIHGIALPAYNRTPQYATVAPPSLSGLTTPRTISW